MKAKKHNILLVGDAATCTDLEYISGFRAVDASVFLYTPQGKHLVVPEMEAGRAGQAAKAVRVWTPRGLGLRKRTRAKVSHWAASLVQRLNIRRVVVATTFPLGIARALEKKGITVRMTKEPLFPERAIKSPDECRKITEAQQAAVIAMRQAVALIADTDVDEEDYLKRDRERLTSEAVRKVINHTLLDHNCMCNDTIVAGGPQGADPHTIGAGPLKAHQPIVLDIFPRHLVNGYWGDLTRTVVRGTATPRTRKMFHAVKAAQAAALERLRPGVKCATVHRHAAQEFDRRGFQRRTVNGRHVGFIHSTGHGVGLAVHEAPRLGPDETRLRKGHVVTVEPGLYYPEQGGVRIEDTVVITGDGWRYLVPCEKKLEV